MYLGLDLGTGSLKAAIVGDDPTPHWVGEERYDVQMTPTRAQIAPDAWWDACVRALSGAPADLLGAVRAIGLSGQMHGVVLVDADDRPLHDAILWPDRRAADQLHVFERIAADQPGVLGNPIVPGMPGPVLAWLRQHEPDLLARTHLVVSPKDWLRSRLTGEAPIVTDASDASATLMYDVSGDDWSSAVVEALGLPPAVLPTIVDSSAAAGHLTAEASRQLGVPAGIPVAIGAGDAAAALLGLGVEQPGRVLVNAGTGAQVIAVVDSTDPGRAGLGLHQFRTAGNDARWYLMAPIVNAGLALSWVKQVLKLEWHEVYDQASLALDRRDTDPRFVPFLAGERDPRVGSDAQAAWVRLSTHHDAAAMARSALLGVTGYLARRTRTVLEITGADRVLMSGGASRHGDWVELLATLIDAEIHLAPDGHASARGAAVMAARARGEALAVPPERGAVTPRPDLRTAADEVLGWAELGGSEPAGHD